MNSLQDFVLRDDVINVRYDLNISIDSFKIGI